MNLLLESAVLSSAIVAAALAIMPLLRRRQAALRHGVLLAALGCAAIAPAAGRIAPSWRLPYFPSLAMVEETLTPAAPAIRSDQAGAAATRAGSIAPASAPANRIVPIVHAVWLTGAALGVLMLATGLARLWRLAARARPMESAVWVERADRIGRELGITQPIALLVSAQASLVATWGLRRPKIVVPSAAARWTDERVRLVLYHELAHIRRADWLVLLAAELLKSVYWFNPLMWLACARLRQESEQACDDAVIARGVDGADYAGHLVEIARDLNPPPRWLPALAIARPSSLERRVRAMLDARLNRRPVPRAAYAVATVTILAATIALASAQGVSRLSGSIVDPSNGAMPGVTLVLTNLQTEAKYEVRTDSLGRYEFAALTPGEYAFEAKLPGFKTVKGRVVVAGTPLQRDLAMEIGVLEETVTVSGSRTATSDTPATVSTASRGPRPDCTPPQPADGLAVGGSIRPPLKLSDVRPVYPAQLASQGIQGTVLLSAQIGPDGRVNDITVMSAPHAMLATAAADAVRQWEFSETLLNCVPVAVAMKVTVNFTVDR